MALNSIKQTFLTSWLDGTILVNWRWVSIGKSLCLGVIIVFIIHSLVIEQQQNVIQCPNTNQNLIKKFFEYSNFRFRFTVLLGMDRLSIILRVSSNILQFLFSSSLRNFLLISFMLVVWAIGAAVTYLLLPVNWFMETIGFLAVFTEAMLGKYFSINVPRFIQLTFFFVIVILNSIT